MTSSIAPRQSAPKLLHLQILRALAASLVVVDHTYNELYQRGAMFSPNIDSAYLQGHLGVSAFFVLSGFIMMRQSADKFGSPANALTFAWHRILRIVPLYWIATVLGLGAVLVTHTRILRPAFQLVLSLLFLPNVGNSGKPLPILPQGWTLNFEMAFYLLFAICLLFNRRRGVILLISTLCFLVLMGDLFDVTPLHRLRDIWHIYTHWRILLFAAGVALGMVEIRLGGITRWRQSISPAWLLLLPVTLLLLPQSPFPNAGTTLKVVSLYGAIVVVLCTLVGLERPGRFNRLCVLLGDASYSTYLFHMWAFTFTMVPILALYARSHRTPQSPIVFLVPAIIAANLIGLAVHLFVERPITQALRRVTFRRKVTPSTDPAISGGSTATL